jgi:hypothetical protein
LFCEYLFVETHEKKQIACLPGGIGRARVPKTRADTGGAGGIIW